MSGRYGITYDLSYTLLQSAAYFSRQAFTWEAELLNQSKLPKDDPRRMTTLRYKDFGEEHEAYCLGAVVLAVAFLDASVSSVFGQAKERLGSLANEGLTKNQVASLALLARLDLLPRQILQRAQLAIQAIGREPFPRGRGPYQEAAALLRLRNAFMHAFPETVWFPEGEQLTSPFPPDRFEKEFGPRFPDNRTMPNSLPYFPYRCLGHGCAEWSVKTSIRFIDSFYERLGMDKSGTSRRRFEHTGKTRPEGESA